MNREGSCLLRCWTFAVILSSVPRLSQHVEQKAASEARRIHETAADSWGGFISYLFQFSQWVMSDSLRPHELQHTRLPYPSPTPGVHPNPCPLSRWCHPTISSSVIPFSSCLQSFPESGSFQMSQLSALGGQSIGVSASASVLPVNIQDWSPLGWTGWISLQSKGLCRVFSNTTVQKHQFFDLFKWPQIGVVMEQPLRINEKVCANHICEFRSPSKMGYYSFFLVGVIGDKMFQQNNRTR